MVPQRASQEGEREAMMCLAEWRRMQASVGNKPPVVAGQACSVRVCMPPKNLNDEQH